MPGRAYRIFADDLKRSPTTRACIFATVHADASLELARQLEESGLICYVGKVNMDRDSPDDLREAGPEESERETRRFLTGMEGFQRIKPILTPRFVPSCSDGCMERLGALQREFGLPVQSHLSENQGEIAWVKELCPWSGFYGDAYDHFGLFGNGVRTIMAHCVWPPEEEVARMRDNGVFVAHWSPVQYQPVIRNRAGEDLSR